MKSINLLALPGARELQPQTDVAKELRVARAMHSLLDDYVEVSAPIIDHNRYNPTLYAHNIDRPALVGTLRAQAGLPAEGEEPESWRLLLSRFKQPGLSSIVMSYTVYLGSSRYMENGLDVGVVGGQLHAGNGLLADRQIGNLPIDIAEVPGVADAIIEDLETLRTFNGIVPQSENA